MSRIVDPVAVYDRQMCADHNLAEAIWTCSSTPDRARPGRVLSDLMVEMRDGISLATDVYLPDTDGPFATVMIRLPYGKTVDYCGVAEIARHWNRKGYAFVGQDCRGTYGSGGVFDPAHPHSEAEDGHDTVAWVAEQAWSSGRVALTGESYYSLTSFAAASIPHPALACIVPGDFPVDRFDGTYRNGCLRLAAEALWAIWWTDPVGHPVPGEPLPTVDVWHLPTAGMARAAGLPNHYFDELVKFSQPGSRYWEYRCRREAHDAIEIPILHFCGWYDNYLGQQLRDWKRYRRLDRSGGRNFLMIGPWSHEGPSGPAERVGIVPVVEDGTHRWDRMQAFYDRYLMGLENGFEDEPRVSYFVIGADEWRGADTWPPPGGEPQTWYLHGGGGLSTEAPGDEQPDTYAYDPADPVAWTVGTNPWTFGLNLTDRRPVEARPDVLVYTSAPLPEPVEVIGDMSAHLHVSSDAVDTDFTAALVDVFPDGAANLIQDGILRMGLREPERGRQLLEPGRVYEVEIDLWAIAYRIPAGHRLRVEISSSEFDRYDRNLNTAALPGEGSDIVVAHQTVFHDASRPSHVSIPVRPVSG
jgi:putative CocE/NonD family hydrolase